jgi:PLP dependent protein
MIDLEKNLTLVQERIRVAAEKAGRRVDEITLVAVSKTVPAETAVAACELGVRHLGENRVEDARVKVPIVNGQVRTPVTWHMVGHLQHRKVKDAVDLFQLVHSVDSLSLAKRIASHAAASGKLVPVLLEVNVSGEASKYGFAPEPRALFFDAVSEMLGLPALDVQGLMTIAPVVADPEQARPYFRALHQLRQALGTRFQGHAWRHLSMGMTDDFEAAIAEGATLVRIGRAIFGARPRH